MTPQEPKVNINIDMVIQRLGRLQWEVILLESRAQAAEAALMATQQPEPLRIVAPASDTAGKQEIAG